MRTLFALLLCVLVTPAFAQDRAGSEDHPAVSRYPGSVIKWHDIQNFAPYKIATGPVTGYRQIDEWLEVEGRLTRIYYELSGERTHVEVFENYRQALAEQDFEILAEGVFPQSNRGRTVGGAAWLQVYFASNALPTSEGIQLLAGSSTSGGSAFVAGRKDRAAGPIYVAITVRQYSAEKVVTQIDVLEEQAVETGLVVIDAEAIGKDMVEYGRVVLDGILFEFDKAVLKPESDAALEQISLYLNAHPDMEFYVVGHTDSKGKFDYNERLSRDRASAVVEALVGRYSIAPGRLSPRGVGPLVPVFNNGSDAGRERNRRVELVER